MSDTQRGIVAEHPYLAILGVAVLAAVVDVVVSVVITNRVDPTSTAFFVVIVTAVYAFLLYRRGALPLSR